MFDNEKLDQAMGILGDLTPEQKDLVHDSAQNNTPEKELLDGLKELGADLDEATFEEFLSAATKTAEDEVFDQEVSPDELEAVAGGDVIKSEFNCTELHIRYIYIPHFPNCAATVEDGSWCNTNDACIDLAIDYWGMRYCAKAWK